jgi:hypothetical protein
MSQIETLDSTPASWFLLKAGAALLDVDPMQGAREASTAARLAAARMAGVSVAQAGPEGVWQLRHLTEYLQPPAATAQPALGAAATA